MATSTGLRTEIVRPVAGEALPRPDSSAAVVVLGGPQSAYDDIEHPYLADEVAFLAAAHDAGVPVLGICLGFQLLTRALGGEVYPGPSGLECGFIDVKAVDAAGAELAGRHFSFHSDTANVPAGATLLARSDRYVQAWRHGHALAVQFHPELDQRGINLLLDEEEDKLARFGVDVAALREEIDDMAAATSPGERLLTSWINSLSTSRKPAMPDPTTYPRRRAPCPHL
ncbi:type 1 glutamine amidotransferase [Micromonospora sp. CPCC 206060]|uniref:type 1 glutamine amidotransferase n=1 Tax=Micromonospora sp. CPCC 206060 TaxID=3122406 RepID=UPI002FF356F4